MPMLSWKIAVSPTLSTLSTKYHYRIERVCPYSSSPFMRAGVICKEIPTSPRHSYAAYASSMEPADPNSILCSHNYTSQMRGTGTPCGDQNCRLERLEYTLNIFHQATPIRQLSGILSFESTPSAETSGRPSYQG